jgi:hypothetical protein
MRMVQIVAPSQCKRIVRMLYNSHQKPELRDFSIRLSPSRPPLPLAVSCLAEPPPVEPLAKWPLGDI